MAKFRKTELLRKRQAFVSKIVDEILMHEKKFDDYCLKFDITLSEEILSEYEKRTLELATLKQERDGNKKVCDFNESNF